MKKAIFGFIASSVLASAAFAQDLGAVPVHGKPVWQQVVSMAQAPGSPIAVQSLSTNQVIGSLPVDSSFLSFGTNGQIVTLAFNGEIGYVPAVAVMRRYPLVPEPEGAPAGPETLEELAEAYEERVTGQAAVSLRLKNSLAAPTPQAGLIPQGNIPGAPGLGFGGGVGINPQPGAALATGGVRGVGAMVPGAPGFGGGGPQMK